MQPQTQNESQPTVQSHPQISDEPFVRQVEDRTLPALQVLTEQRKATDSDVEIRVFIP